MLVKKNRLKKEKDFKEVFDKGKRFKQSFLYLKIKNNKLKLSRFGFIVSKKVSLKAVVRNKIKRRLRELIKAQLPKIKNQVDGIIVVMPHPEESFEELRELVNKLFKKAGLI